MLEEKNPYIQWIPIGLIIPMLLGTILLLCLPKKDFSEKENRYLEKFPTLTLETIKDHSFMKGIENYTGDHFPYRAFFLNTKAKNEQRLGKDENKNVYLGKNNYLIEKYTLQTKETREKIASTINRFTENNKEKEITVMLIPTSITINQANLPSFVNSNIQHQDQQEIYKALNGSNNIDITKVLKQKNLEEPMFYRLDHHWTTKGAYYGYVEFQKSKEKEAQPITNFQKEIVTNSFKGTLDSKVNLFNLPPDQIEILIPKETTNFQINYVYQNKITSSFYEQEWLTKKDKYSYFLNGNHPLIEINNQTKKDDSNLLIIKDSYANSFIPIIANDYERIAVIDPRYYKYSITEYATENHYTNILFLYNMNTIGNDLGILSIQ